MKQYHKNPRQITKKEYADLQSTLRELGDLSGIVHDLNSDEIIGGNQRSLIFDINKRDIEIVKTFDEPDEQGTVALGFVLWEGKKYNYREVRWNERQCEKANIVANKAGGSWDFDILANEWDVPDLVEWGFTPEELGITIDEPVGEDPGAQIDKAEELREKWGVESGQLWRLGEHRLICGDCTDKQVVELVMGGGLASLIWTDPPYGVDYGAKLDAASPMGYRARSIENDNLPADQLEELIRNAFRNCAEFSVPGASIYAACPAGTLLPTAIAAFVGSGFTFRWQLVWVKDQLVLSRADYHFKHENILYGWKPDAAHYFTDDRKQVSTFEVARPKRSDEHPTMKPVELIEQMITNSSKMGDIVLEPFDGSGSTIIACERLGRKCRAVEISPAYCAVAIQRWVDMTGGVPELIV